MYILTTIVYVSDVYGDRAWTCHTTHVEVTGKAQVSLPSTPALHGTGRFELILPACVANDVHTKLSSSSYLTMIFENQRIGKKRE